jgi:NAD(P)-dependent dehydrogenase (short-subunit alcohol dehydrogenase family)
MSAPGFGFTPGDVVVVTGAGSGIGRATAVHAAELRLAVAAWDRDGATVAGTVTEIEKDGGRAVAVTADVTVPEEVETGFARSRELGVVRHLVNNAGPSSAVDLDFDEALVASVGSMRRMVDTWLAACAPDAASLVNIASVAGTTIGTASGWYCASKSAIAGWTRHLAAYRSDEVRSNAVAPGMTDTPRLARCRRQRRRAAGTRARPAAPHGPPRRDRVGGALPALPPRELRQRRGRAGRRRLDRHPVTGASQSSVSRWRPSATASNSSKWSPLAGLIPRTRRTGQRVRKISAAAASSACRERWNPGTRRAAHHWATIAACTT